MTDLRRYFNPAEAFIAPGIFELRQDLLLPSVSIDDLFVVDKIALLASRVIDFEIPGLGIEPGINEDVDDFDLHKKRVDLVTRALKTVDPSLDMEDFMGPYTTTSPRPHHTGMHVDGDGHSLGFTREGNMELELRLHTSTTQPADITIVNARVQPEYCGDVEFYTFDGELIETQENFGRDSAIERVRQRGTYQMIEDRLCLPIFDVESKVYHHRQSKGGSILMRTKATSGTIAAHAFMSEDPNLHRYIEISTAIIKSRSVSQ